MGMDGSMGPPGSQNNLGPSNSEGSLYSPSRYPSQQRSALSVYECVHVYRKSEKMYEMKLYICSSECKAVSVVFFLCPLLYQARWLWSAVSRYAIRDASIWDVSTATGELQLGLLSLTAILYLWLCVSVNCDLILNKECAKMSHELWSISSKRVF